MSIERLSRRIEGLEKASPGNRIEYIVVLHNPGEPIEVINLWGGGFRKIAPENPEYAKYQGGTEWGRL